MTDFAVFYDVVDKLSEDRKGVLLQLARDMLSAQTVEDFDTYSPEEIRAIRQASEEVARGEGLSFSSAEEFARYFGV